MNARDAQGQRCAPSGIRLVFSVLLQMCCCSTTPIRKVTRMKIRT